MTNAYQQETEAIARLPQLVLKRVDDAIADLAMVFPRQLGKYEVVLNQRESRVFAAYLMCLASNVSGTKSLIERYQTAHVGTYASTQELLADVGRLLAGDPGLTEQDWQDLARVGIADLQRWADATIWNRLADRFYIVDTGHKTYVFAKDR